MDRWMSLDYVGTSATTSTNPRGCRAPVPAQARVGGYKSSQCVAAAAAGNNSNCRVLIILGID